jgi:hypothetical protein
MRASTRFSLAAGVLCAAATALVATVLESRSSAQQAQGSGPQGVITGVVQGPKGPEGGVWVIAETKDLPTNFIKIVVTDEQGRFAVPELPAASYSVWVRGYGLVDSSPMSLKPGSAQVTLKVNAAGTPQEAAKVYPGNYWLSLLEPPAKTMFPGTGAKGNGVGTGMLSQNHWINSLKSDCNFCHQLGNALTRSVDHVLKAKPELKTHAEAWEWRLGTGVRGDNMYAVLSTQGKDPTLRVLSDWSERIAKGEVPPAPPRPRGVERNVVVTLWDWGTDHSFMHDEISTDKNRPTVNAGGVVYAVSAGHGMLTMLDPRRNVTEEIEIPTRAPRAEVPSRFPAPMRPSLWWGNQHLWANPPYNPADPHNGMLDSKGRVWMTSKIRPNANPAWCSNRANPYADWFPLTSSGRQASYFDPKTKQFTLVDTCYSTHHLQFDNDADETVYFNELTGPIIGWIDTKVFDTTKDEQKANGWCGQVLDTNGDGRITRPWNRQVLSAAGGSILYTSDTGGPGAPVNAAGAAAPAGSGNVPFDPKLDTITAFRLYSVIPSPVDDSVWGVSEQYPGYLVRLQRGNNPPASCRTLLFKVPEPGFDPRGVDIDSNGVVWTALAASSHLASFDVRKCKDLKGPAKADGTQCREGWTLYQTAGPKLKGTDVPADFHYYNWVDQHNVLGLGANRPIATGSNSDALLVLDPQSREWTTLRVPYPLGFYSRGLDGRIDDPKAGWKGRGLWANYGTHFVWHIEGGKGTKGKLVHFQIRPDPLAR